MNLSLGKDEEVSAQEADLNKSDFRKQRLVLNLFQLIIPRELLTALCDNCPCSREIWDLYSPAFISFNRL